MQADVEEHERLLEALRGDDQAAFSAVVKAHLAWSIDLARASFEPGPQ